MEWYFWKNNSWERIGNKNGSYFELNLWLIYEKKDNLLMIHTIGDKNTKETKKVVDRQQINYQTLNWIWENGKNDSFVHSILFVHSIPILKFYFTIFILHSSIRKNKKVHHSILAATIEKYFQKICQSKFSIFPRAKTIPSQF